MRTFNDHNCNQFRSSPEYTRAGVHGKCVLWKNHIVFNGLTTHEIIVQVQIHENACTQNMCMQYTVLSPSPFPPPPPPISRSLFPFLMLPSYIQWKPCYNEALGTMKITSLYQVSHYIRVKNQRNIKSWDQQNDLVIRGFCYIRPLYNEVPLYCFCSKCFPYVTWLYLDIQVLHNIIMHKNWTFNIVHLWKLAICLYM